MKYQIVRVREEKFFGVKNEWIDDTSVGITDKEKTLIDCLDIPQYAGGIVEVAKALRDPSLSRSRLAEYAQKINNFAVIRRLGYLCDRNGITLDLPLPSSKNYLPLDPTMPETDKRDPKWRLILNLP